MSFNKGRRVAYNKSVKYETCYDIFVQEGVKVVIEPDWGSCTPGFYQCSGSKRVCIPVR
jgi:hypothetical protein